MKIAIKSRTYKIYAPTPINIKRDYLEKYRRSGIRFKLIGKAGEEVFFMPTEHIDAFLEVVK